MHVIAVATQKGGSGKTTLAGHLAVAADAAGAGPVLLIDTDPQRSLARWWEARRSVTPLFVTATATRLSAGIDKIRALGVRFIIIDTPPAIAETIVDAIGLADLVLIPARPSPHDLRAAGATVELVERLGRRMIFVVNCATPRARITTEAVLALSQHGTLAPVIIHQRVSFAESMIDGRTVLEIDGEDRAASEIRQLWDYLASRFERGGEIPPSERLSLPGPEADARAA